MVFLNALKDRCGSVTELFELVKIIIALYVGRFPGVMFAALVSAISIASQLGIPFWIKLVEAASQQSPIMTHIFSLVCTL